MPHFFHLMMLSVGLWHGPGIASVYSPLPNLESPAGVQVSDIAKRALQSAMPEYVRHADFESVNVAPEGLCGGGLIVGVAASPRRIDRVRTREWITSEVHCADGRAEGFIQWFSVRAQGKVPVARSVIEQGALVTEDSITWEIRDVANLRAPPAAFAAVRKLRARSSIAQGQVVEQSFLVEVPEVSRGQRITAVLKSGDVSLTLPLIATQDARSGQKSKAIRPGTDHQLDVLVTGASTVQVLP